MWLKRLSILAVLLACGVVALGAYTRLKDAGLGCPDWPGCYGHLVVPQSSEAINNANAAYPERPLESHKAWPEMIHRYFASTLGLVIFSILVMCIRARKINPDIPIRIPAVLAVLVVFQGLLGMWTVTLGLFPTIVMAHLLGGFTTLCLLFLLAVRLHAPADVGRASTPTPSRAALRFGIIGIAVLAFQIALGGWTAANYAATICSELPICQSGWQQHVNLEDAFQFWGHGVEDYEFATHLGADAKITIHVAHRIGAIITTLYLGSLFIWLLTRSGTTPRVRKAALAALLLLALQVGLGISNVVMDLPLLVAVAHNGVAAILMMSLIFLNLSLYRSRGIKP
ncbi:MAG: COX15/CtaA family protein [Pseudomonadota bacterium]|nr:COX15/CtaA family protein [Pseudomonadota bacterium]